VLNLGHQLCFRRTVVGSYNNTSDQKKIGKVLGFQERFQMIIYMVGD